MEGVALTSEYLALLLNDAAREELEAVASPAHDQRVPAADLAELREQQSLALLLHERLARHRFNESALQLLNDSANDLATLRDLEQILQAIVERARRLASCDLAYISLSDESRGDSYIKAAVGNVSEALLELRLPAGTGLGGLVSRSGEPSTTGHYLADDALVHTSDIDATVELEGIRSLVGVPLKLENEIIGVLMAAHRNERTFAEQEVNMLEMLGAHAAVAIDNARLLQQIQNHSDMFERAAEIHERLTRVVLKGGGLEEVVAATADSLRGPVVLLDENGKVAARAGYGDMPDEKHLAMGWRDAKACGATVWIDALCLVPMLTEAGFLGVLAHPFGGDVIETDLRILERAALVASLVEVTRRRLSEAEARVRGAVLEDLLDSETADVEDLVERARLLGVDITATNVVLVARVEHEPRERLYAAAAALARRSSGLVATKGQDVVVVLPDGPQVVSNVVRDFRGATGAPVTIGHAITMNAGMVRPAYREASRCVQALLRLGRIGDITEAAELGFVGLLLGNEPDTAGFTRSILGPLIDYDRKRRTQLVNTLEAYCASGFSNILTAEALHLHPNTVLQRFDRIARLLGEDWRQPERLLECQVALRVLRVGSQ
ncbi:GAF domain-containing protein [Knoellia sp. S7-12]|uniref:helix-turn-helix domain-containing protein n=1 Tax=Knoellia sp. S7-12 TaxID=3126698 RepID=UPI003368AC57